jgi:hypothetical protein
MEDVGIFYGHLVNFPAVWHILWPFGICSLVLVHFTRFGVLDQEKTGNPGCKPIFKKLKVPFNKIFKRENIIKSKNLIFTRYSFNIASRLFKGNTL